MSLKAAIQNATKTAIDSVGDLSSSVTYKRRTVGAYNAVTGAVSDTFSSVTIKGVLQPSNERNRASTDDTVVEEKVLQVARQTLNFTPKLQDRINDGISDYEVVGVRTDVAEALTTFGLRRI